LWKLEGLDDEALRRPVMPSRTSLLGLVKYLAGAEYGWFRDTSGGRMNPLDPGLDRLRDRLRESRAVTEIAARHLTPALEKMAGT
jgi:hypothetical protein